MSEKNQSINLPKNIKQIGSICDNVKVYIEDYAYTFIHQYSRESKHKEKIGALIGESYVIDGNEIIFISGAIKGKYSELNDGILTLTDKSFSYVENQIENYFQGLKIVGWFYVQPGFEDSISEAMIQYHKANFNLSHQVLFVNDPLENMSNFYFNSKTTGNVELLRGFIIYYEKNQGMNEYMLSNKISQNNKDSNPEIGLEQEQNIEGKVVEDNSKFNKIRTKQKKYKKSYNISNNIASLGLFAGTLFLVTFIMRSDIRIRSLESKLSGMDSSYKYILAQIKQDNVTQVFANDDKTTTQETTKTTEEITTETTTASITEEITNTTSMTKEDSLADETNYNRTYIIEDGDTLTKISKKIYGSTSMVNEIVLANQLENPHKISIGMEIKLP